jgi:hypothetical protein
MLDGKRMALVRRHINQHFILLFSLVFYTSWIYQVEAFGAGGNFYFQEIKTLLMLGLMALLIASITWREIKLDIFLLACAAWFLITLFSWIEYQEPMAAYIRRLGQAVFFFLFVTYLRQNPDRNPCAGPAVKRWFFPWWIFAALWIAVALNVTGWLSADIEAGFGNSRVNFSIWLMQLVALFLFVKLEGQEVKAKALVGCLLLITPAFILQNMTGGRSGMLGSFLLVCLFAYRWGGIKAVLFSGAWLFLLSLGAAEFNPQISEANNLNVFRNLAVTDNSPLDGIGVWLDRLSSYRLSLVITAFSSLDAADYWFGVGLGNFVGWAPTYPELGLMEVHNVLLKLLGEYGIFGFLTAAILTLWPFAYRPANGMQKLALSVQCIYFIVAMVHPDLMLTAINVSLVYLCFYAYSAAARAVPLGQSRALEFR